MGITIAATEIKTGHVGLECEFYYTGSAGVPVLRRGKIEAVKPSVITLEFEDGTFKSFSISKIDSVFLYT